MAGYAAIHLLFVVPGVLVGDRGLLRAVWESIVLIHTDFPGAMGLAVLMLILYRGLALAWLQPTGDSWYMLIGIVGNSCIATALTAAAFVFYKERTKHLVKKPAPAQGTSV